VEKRSGDGGETEPPRFPGRLGLPGLKEGVILTGQQSPEGIADFYLQRGVKAVVIKTGPMAPGIKPPAANKARSPR
jgi:sugar/nucleoside kinase (ribokinase family)